MWSMEFSAEVRASPECLWAWYEDTARAPSWDPLIAEIRADGPLARGNTGRNRPKRGPSAPFEYTQVTRSTSYTEVTRVPGARMAFTHHLLPHGDTTTVVHGMECTGPMTAVYRLLMRRSITRGMPQALQGLARLAEAGPPGPPAG